DIRRHQRLLDLRVAAFGTDDLARLALRLIALAIAKPGLELMAGTAAQRKPDHRANLLTLQHIMREGRLANSDRQCQSTRTAPIRRRAARGPARAARNRGRGATTAGPSAPWRCGRGRCAR